MGTGAHPDEFDLVPIWSETEVVASIFTYLLVERDDCGVLCER